MADFAPVFNFPSNKLYQYETGTVLLSCNAIVDSTNGNGLGIRSLKGAGIANIFMHTTQTPGLGNGLALNPNPAAGIVVVQLQNNYNRYLSGFSGFVSPTATTTTSTVSNLTYVIVSLGTATLAQWQAAGVPVGFTPAVGLAFVAKQTATIGGSAAVQVPTASLITSIEVVGDPNPSLQNSNMRVNGGAQIILQCLSTATKTAPADGSVIGLNFYLSNSSVTVSGQ